MIETASSISAFTQPALPTVNNDGDFDKLKEACQEFESYFLSEMIKNMRKTVPDGGLIKKSNGEKIYQEMLDSEYASNISKEKGVGLSELMFRQLIEDKK